MTHPRLCEWCGVLVGDRNGKARYCGRTCSEAAGRDRRRDKRNADRRAEWADPECSRRVAHLEYRERNAEQVRQWARDYRAANPGRHRGYYAAWLAEPGNYQRVLLNSHTRRARQRQNPGSVGITVRDWLRLVRRYGGCCAYCDTPVARPVVEHVIPIARGGRHAIGNVLPVCESCNGSKHSSLIVEWRARQRRVAA